MEEKTKKKYLRVEIRPKKYLRAEIRPDELPEVLLKFEFGGFDHETIHNWLGVNEELPEKLLGISYEEFLKKYPHLYSNNHGYLLDDDPKRIFNIDVFADYSEFYESVWIDMASMARWNLTKKDLEDAVMELKEIASKIAEFIDKKELEFKRRIEELKAEFKEPLKWEFEF